MSQPETLIPRLSRRDLREYATRDNDLVIARQLQPGSWLVTAHSADLRGEAQGEVWFNEAGFRGRQWTSTIDGQEYPSLIAAVREAVSIARRRADIAAFAETVR